MNFTFHLMMCQIPNICNVVLLSVVYLGNKVQRWRTTPNYLIKNSLLNSVKQYILHVLMINFK